MKPASETLVTWSGTPRIPSGGVLAVERDVWVELMSQIKQGVYDL
ncbi:hypothetical protein [Actinomadura sp. KC06]|nr:hypothetical protein [Actinomadura sp. KC06]